MTYADSSRPLLIHEFTCAGIITVPATSNLEESIEYIRRLVQINPITKRPSIYVLKKNCPVTAKQMRKYRYVHIVKPGQVDKRLNPTAAKPVPLKYEDDTCDAVRYMVYGDRTYSGRGPGVASTLRDPARFGIHLQDHRK